MISPSLLATIPAKRSKECHKQFRLGLGEFTDSSEDSPTEMEAPSQSLPKKRPSRSLRKRGKGEGKDKENRWNFIDETKEEALGKKYVAKNTAVCTKWAITNFTAW